MKHQRKIINKRGVRVLALLALLVAALALVACGGGDDGGDGGGTEQTPAAGSGSEAGGTAAASDDQGVKYSECMREHGVKDFPDPVDGRIQLRAGPGSSLNPNSATFKAAEEACRSLQPAGAQNGGPGGGGGGEQALAFSKCMRENGVPKFPDPQTSGGKVTMQLAPDSGVDPDSAAFKKAQAKCGNLGGGQAQGATP
jgi:hypothetical protein